MKRFSLQWARLWLLAGAGLLAGACAMPGPPYVMTPGFSVNIVTPTLTKDVVAALPPVRKQVYDEFGPPDYMRLLWNPKGELVTSQKEYKRLENRSFRTLDQTWIYLELGKEIRFLNDRDYRMLDLTDQVRTFCEYGDPGKTDRMGSGATFFYQCWYYDRGVFYKFDPEGRLLGEGHYASFPGLVRE